jgi:hypothetical protein
LIKIIDVAIYPYTAKIVGFARFVVHLSSLLNNGGLLLTRSRRRLSDKSRKALIFLLIAILAVILPLSLAAGDTYTLTVVPVIVEWNPDRVWDGSDNAYLMADLSYFVSDYGLMLNLIPPGYENTNVGAATVFTAAVPKDNPYITLSLGEASGILTHDYYKITKLDGTSAPNTHSVNISLDSDTIMPLFIVPIDSSAKALVLYSPNGGSIDASTLPSGFGVSGTITMQAGKVQFYKSNTAASHAFVLVGDTSVTPPSAPGVSPSAAPSGALLDRVELDEALELAHEALNGDASYSAGSLAILEAAITAAVATFTTQSGIDEATTQLRTALYGLSYLSSSLGGGSETTAPIELSLVQASLASDLPANSTIAADVYVTGASSLSTLVLNFEYSADTLGFEYAGGSANNSFKIISVAQGSGTLSVAVMNPNLFSDNGVETALARLRFRAKAAGTGTVTLTSGFASSLIGTSKDTPVEIISGTVTTTVVPGMSPLALDFNGDGVITLADLTTGMPYYRVTSRDFEWIRAQEMDYDDDGIITVKDYAMIVNEMRDADWGVFDE